METLRMHIYVVTADGALLECASGSREFTLADHVFVSKESRDQWLAKQKK